MRTSAATAGKAPQSASSPPVAALFRALYFLSGLAFLAMETIWIRAVSVHTGNTVASATLVVAAFFAWAAAGGWAGGRLAPRVSYPARAYGACEAASAVAAAVAYPFIPALARMTEGSAPGADPGLRFVFVSLVLGAPSFLAGATFPLLSEAFVRRPDSRTSDGSPFYGWNLAGAALGVVAGGLWLPAHLGFRVAFLAAAAVLLGVGATAMIAGGRLAAGVRQAASPAPDGSPALGRAGFLLLAGSGFLSVALEILCLLYGQQLMTSSIYVSSVVLFAFVVDLGAGCLLAGRLRRMGWGAERLLLAFLPVTGLLALAYPFLFHVLMAAGPMTPDMTAGTALFSRAALGAALLLPLLLAAGAIFPLAWELADRAAPSQGRALGHAVVCNKLACAAGAVAAGRYAVAWLGLPGAFMATGVLYLLLALVLQAARGASRRRLLAVAVPGAALSALALVLRPLPVALQPGERLLGTYQGRYGVAAVVEDAGASRRIILNQTYALNGTQRAMASQRNEARIPAMLWPGRGAGGDPAAPSLLFIGMGSGISAAAAQEAAGRLWVAELAPEVVEASRIHFAEWNRSLYRDGTVVQAGDGRRLTARLRGAGARAPLIICDLMMPANEGTAWLYSRDYLETARAALGDEGRFCLWLPLYQVDEELAGIVIRTFTDVFPCAIAVRGNLDPLQPVLGLVGANAPIAISQSAWSAALAAAPAAGWAADSPFFRSPAHLLLALAGDLQASRADFDRYPPTTDDRPVFAFRGPRQLGPGTVLRGRTYLNWFGNRFAGRGFPSCRIEGWTEEDLRRAIAAGNNAFAAACDHVTLPPLEDAQAEAARRVERTRRTAAHLARARDLWPAAVLGVDDLGQ